jgi:formylglycine-generating enzyme required for sulfatase activity/tRNA A-37 threonylcarbamoyl transferase component Bud32
MNACECLQPDRLRDYLLGSLGEGEEQEIDAHVDSCFSCSSALSCLDAEIHAPFAGLRLAPGQPLDNGPGFRNLVLQAKRLSADRPHSNGMADSLAGHMLGNYQLQERIGAGGMGEVFRAEHCRLHRLVAVKVLAPEWFRSEAARARFRREVETLARVRSPHIVAAHDAGESDGRDFLVMEYVEGRNLAELVKERGPLPAEQALDFLLQAARGLQDAHAAGIIHRDVKPANLLVDGKGVVKVLDLGLARITVPTPGAADLTAQQAMMGTAAYMAPEQALDTRRADARADVYGLGCTLYFLLTGQAPYVGDNPMQVLLAHREQPIPSLPSARPDCPPTVAALFRAMTAKKPDDRPASMERVISLLERLRQPGALTRRPGLRNKIAVTAGLAACLLVALALAVAPLQDKKSDQPRREGDSRITAVAPVSSKPPTIEMFAMPPGEFWMGASESDKNAFDDEKPRHKVKITQPFHLAKTKVTQAQYEEVMGANPSAFSARGRFKDKVKGQDTSQHPVESISWLDAVRFCNRLSERHGLEPYYQIEGKTVTIHGGTGYRLPTEAEWEYACRADTDTLWSFGEKADDLGSHAWYADNSGDTTHPVAEKKANPWGLFDVHGNVPEWCWDRYDAEYYRRSPTSDPPGSGKGDVRVHRGGAWNSQAAQTRSSTRESRGMAYSVLDLVGLRVARNAP